MADHTKHLQMATCYWIEMKWSQAIEMSKFWTDLLEKWNIWWTAEADVCFLSQFLFKIAHKGLEAAAAVTLPYVSFR